jgi:hypothetical protein
LANSEEYKTVKKTAIAFGVISIILAALIPNVDNLMTTDITATLHKGENGKIVGEHRMAEPEQD